MTHRITVLRTLGPALAKTWQADGGIGNYDNALQYRVKREAIGGLDELAVLLNTLQRDPRSCVIRGAPAEGLDLAAVQVRRLGTFVDAPSHLFMVDIDNYRPMLADVVSDPAGAIEEFLAEHCPPCFNGAAHVWQLSGSHGHPSKAGQLRAHVWFWLAEPLTCDQAEAWATKYLPASDHTVHRTVQVNYTANPVMRGGQTDPIRQRLGYVPPLDLSPPDRGGLGDLCLPADMPVPDVSELKRVTREDRRALADPRDKPGVIGALCRAYTPEEIVTLLPDSFAAGRTPERITWLHGGGTTEGVRVTDSGTHLFNSHSTAPVQRACNLFDFIRMHEYGHLDEHIDDDALALDVTAAPSYQATHSWALTLPGVQAEIIGPKAEAVVEAAADAKAEQALSASEERAQRMANISARIASAASVDVLEHDLARRVAKAKTFSDTDREQLAAAMRQRTVALVPGSRGLPLAMVRKWLKPAADELQATFAHVNEEGNPILTRENVQALAARLSTVIRCNVITKEQEILPDGVPFGDDNRANNTLTWLKCEANKVRLLCNTADLKAVVALVADANPFNPVQAWLDSRAWDGRSRLHELADTLVSPPGADPAHKLMVLRKWLIQCAAVALSPAPIQARGVLTLQGPQYGGKTKWLKSLCPGQEHLVMTGRQVDPHSRDSVMVVIRHWLVELGELDATFKRSDVAALKAFIAQDVDMHRAPYAAAETKHQRRTSMFATVNDDEFLADPTGNSRFWVLAVTTVNHEHAIDMQQVWAEVAGYWRAGEPHWLTQEQMTRVNLHGEQFETADPVRELISEHKDFAWAALEDARVLGTEFAGKWVRLTATQVLRRVGASAGSAVDTKRAGAALRALGARKAPRTHGGVRGWLVPALEDFAEFDG